MPHRHRQTETRTCQAVTLSRPRNQTDSEKRLSHNCFMIPFCHTSYMYILHCMYVILRGSAGIDVNVVGLYLQLIISVTPCSVRCAVALLLIQAARLSSKTLKILAVLCHARQCNAWCYVTLCYVTLRHAMLCRPNVIVGCHPNGRVGYGKRGDLRRSGRERDAEGRLMWAEGVGNGGIWRLDRASRREVEDGGILKWHFTVLERLRPFSLYCNKQLWGRAE